MELLIHPGGGMAGDMFSAGLVSAGADFKWIRNVMVAAGQKLGSVQIDIKKTLDGASQLSIKLAPDRRHLGGNEAKEILLELFNRFNIREKYRNFGIEILKILIKAERKAHAEFNIVVEGDHSHFYHHYRSVHDHSNGHHHTHRHGHRYEHEEETFLHEAQDIVIDIMGAVAGMQQLDIEPEAELLAPVSVGGGYVVFSHGRLSIPAPATTIILREYNIEWERGPVEVELFTPTGAAILAALGSRVNPSLDIETLDVKAIGTARGTKILDIPPLKFFLIKEVEE
jgi:uncharacterized protein (DUF111 family)